MTIPYDVARCEGVRCPSKQNCARFLERDTPRGVTVAFAAFYACRESTADYCDSIIPVEVRAAVAAPATCLHPMGSLGEHVESEGGHHD